MIAALELTIQAACIYRMFLKEFGLAQTVEIKWVPVRRLLPEVL